MVIVDGTAALSPSLLQNGRGVPEGRGEGIPTDPYLTKNA